MSLLALLRKDLRRELRARDGLLTGLVLVGLSFLVVLFAAPSHGARTTAALLWGPLVFATVALLGRGFATEIDRGTIMLLRAAPVPLAWHGWSRTIVHTLVAALVAGVTLALAAGLFAFMPTWHLVVTLALAVVGLSVVGTLASALAAQARLREVLLPVLLIPVAAPLLQAGVQATMDALNGATTAAFQTTFLLMAGYDVAALGVAWLLWPLVLEGD